MNIMQFEISHYTTDIDSNIFMEIKCICKIMEHHY